MATQAEMSGGNVTPSQPLMDSTRRDVHSRKSGGAVIPVPSMTRVSSAGHSPRSGKVRSFAHPFNLSSVSLAFIFSTGGAARSLHLMRERWRRRRHPRTSGACFKAARSISKASSPLTNERSGGWIRSLQLNSLISFKCGGNGGSSVTPGPPNSTNLGSFPPSLQHDDADFVVVNALLHPGVDLALYGVQRLIRLRSHRDHALQCTLAPPRPSSGHDGPDRRCAPDFLDDELHPRAGIVG